MSLVYLSLGSNLGDRYTNLRLAVSRLQDHLAVTSISPVYATEPWGDTDQPAFLNICVAATTRLPPHELLDLAKSIEREMGRQETRHWGPRLIDIDIIFYDHQVLHDEDLDIPHPRMAERAFVLAPLANLIPDFVDPVSGQTVQEMLDRVDSSGVERLFEMPFPTNRNGNGVALKRAGLPS